MKNDPELSKSAYPRRSFFVKLAAVTASCVAAVNCALDNEQHETLPSLDEIPDGTDLIGQTFSLEGVGKVQILKPDEEQVNEESGSSLTIIVGSKAFQCTCPFKASAIRINRPECNGARVIVLGPLTESPLADIDISQDEIARIGRVLISSHSDPVEISGVDCTVTIKQELPEILDAAISSFQGAQQANIRFQRKRTSPSQAQLAQAEAKN